MGAFCYINMKGTVKEVLLETALSELKNGRKDFFICDENGNAIAVEQLNKPQTVEVKKNAAPVTPERPDYSFMAQRIEEITKTDDNEKAAAETISSEAVTEEPAKRKRGRQPKSTNNQ